MPIAFTGDRSLTMWKQFGDDIIKSLKLKDTLINELKTIPQSDESIDNVAREVAIFIHNVIQKKCFVLMPFGGKHDEFYLNTLMPAIDKAEYIPDRIDINNQTGNIYSLFIYSVEQARAVIVDITGLNENVMYELGYVHAKNINPLIIHRSSPDESVE